MDDNSIVKKYYKKCGWNDAFKSLNKHQFSIIISQFTERERVIFTERALQDSPPTLVQLGVRFGLTKVAITTIEKRVAQKIVHQINALTSQPAP